MRRSNSSINETLCGDAAGHTNDRATKESLPRLGQRQNNVAATRRSSSADFLSLLRKGRKPAPRLLCLERKKRVRKELTLRQACRRRSFGAICVQRFDDSRNSAIHTTYRISLRSSSMREPRYPLLKVVYRWKVDARTKNARNATNTSEKLIGCFKFERCL